MRLAFISDIHGNAVALRQCLEHILEIRADRVYFLGDAVGYFPGEQDVLGMLEEVGAICQKGNHEAMLAELTLVPNGREHVYRLGPVRERLSATARSCLAAWPDIREAEIDDRRLLLVHGAPSDPLFGYVHQEAVRTELREASYDAVFMGHTHRPFVQHVGGRLYVNVGSVSAFRETRGIRALSAVYDSESHRCQIRRFRLDVGAVLSEYGHDIDEQVRACLLRDSAAPEGE